MQIYAAALQHNLLTAHKEKATKLIVQYTIIAAQIMDCFPGGCMTKSESADASKFRMPGIDIDALVASQQKTFEALVEANRIAVEGAQAVLRYQLEIGRRAADEFSIVVCDFVRPNGSLEDRVAKQGEYSKQAMEKGLSSARELGG
jgi:hypothetical protein